MSKENVEIVRGFLDAYNRRDREAVASLLHPEVEWHTIAAPIFGIEVIHGRDEMLRFMFELIPDGLEDFKATVGEMTELPDGQMLVGGHYTGRGVTSAAEVELNTAAIYRFEEGMIVFFREFATRDEALEAAGLRK